MKTLTMLCVFGTAISAALLGSHPAQGATLTWTGASGTSWNGANWLGGATTFNAGDIGVFGATASAPTNQIGVGYGSATAPLGGIDIRNDGSYGVTFTGGVIYMGSGGLTSTRSTAGSVSIGNNIRFTTDQVWNIGSGANVTMSASLYNSGNATVGTNNNFEKTGSGTLTLVGTAGDVGGAGKTFKITDGVVSIANNGALGSGSSTLDLNGGTLQTTASLTLQTTGSLARAVTLSANSTIRPTSGNLTISGTISGAGGLAKAGDGTLTLSAANTYTGTTTLSAGVLSVGADSGLGDTTSRLVFSGGTLEVTGTTMTSLGSRPVSFTSGADVGIRITGTNNFALSNNLTQGTGGLTFAGSSSVSQLTLSGSNSGFTGTITVMSGKLNFGNLSNGGANSVSASNALVMNGSSVVSLGNVFTNGNANIGPLSSSSPNAVINTFNGLGAGIRTLVVNQDIDTTFAGALQQDNSANSRFLGLTKAGVGTLALTGSNIHSGGSTVVAGTLRVGNANALGVSTGPLAVNGGTLDLGGFSVAVGALSGSAGGVITTNAVAGTATLTTAVGSGTSIFGGVIQNNGPGVVALTKSGAGVLALTGANTFTGATTISAGGIGIVDVNALQNTSGVNIADGAAFGWGGGAATFARNITVTSGTGTVGNVGGGLLTLAGTLTKNGTVLRLTGGQFNVTGQIVGLDPNSDLVVNGTSTVTLSNTNSYNGPTFVNQASTLIVGINNAIPSNSTVTLGDATSAGTLDLGTFTNQIGGLTFSGSGGTVRMAANQTASPQLSTSSALTLGSNASLDLAGMQTSAGIYRLISSTALSGSFGSVTGLNSNYLLRYGTVNANEISAQRKAEFGTVAATPAAATIIVGGSTSIGYTVANLAPTDGSTLSFSSANGANVIGSSNGTAIAGGTSASISGLVFTGTSVGLNQTGSFTLGDPNAIGSPANGSVSVNVLNHSLASFASTDTSTKTLNFGSYDAGSWSGGDGGNGTLAYSVFNIASLGFSNAETAGLNLYDWAFATGDDVFSVGFSSFANLAAGGSNGFFATVPSPGGLAEGSYTGTYTLKFRDQQDLSGAANTRNLSLTMNVVVVPEPAALALAAIGIAAAAWARRRSLTK